MSGSHVPSSCLLSIDVSCVSCEHYNKTANKNHLHDPTINNGTYDLAYIEAVLCEDQEEVDRIEQAALDLGFGPLLGVCTTVSNASSQKAFCRAFFVFRGTASAHKFIKHSITVGTTENCCSR
jgi:hypothetical protein